MPVSSSHPINIEVEARPNESSEHLIRRFIKKCKKEKLMDEIKEHTSYEKPSDRRRREAKERKETLRKLRMEREGKPTKRTNYKKEKKVHN